jgi:glycosyltransferase involved in cell wall biosynthesis
MMKKPKVSIVTETYYPEVNGVSNTLKYWVEGMQSKGFYIQIIRPRQNPQETNSKTEISETVTVPGLPIPGYKELNFGLPCRRKLLKRWKKDRPEAIYVATEGPLGLSAVKAAKKLNIPILSGFHTNFQSYSKFYRLGWLEPLIFGFLRYFHNLTKATVVPTKTQKEWLSDKGFRNVSVLSRGINSDLFNPTKRCQKLRKSWKVNNCQPVCLYVGRIASEKNISLIMDAYVRVIKKHPNTLFVFVGDGPLKSQLEKKYPNILFVGTKRGEELAKYYASSDIFLFPSKTDTFGNVVTEAMASRLGVIAFNDAAAKEHLENTKSGLIAELDDDEAFIQALFRAIEAPYELEVIRENAYQLAQSLTWNRIVEQFIEKLFEKPSLPLGDYVYEPTQNI